MADSVKGMPILKKSALATSCPSFLRMPMAVMLAEAPMGVMLPPSVAPESRPKYSGMPTSRGGDAESRRHLRGNAADHQEQTDEQPERFKVDGLERTGDGFDGFILCVVIDKADEQQRAADDAVGFRRQIQGIRSEGGADQQGDCAEKQDGRHHVETSVSLPVLGIAPFSLRKMKYTMQAESTAPSSTAKKMDGLP